MSNATQTITWTTQSGKTIALEIEYAETDVFVDGKQIGSAFTHSLITSLDNPYADKIRAAVAAAGGVAILIAGKTPIALKTENVEAIKTAVAAVNADRAASPAALAEKRALLVNAIGAASDAWSAARERAFAADTGHGWDTVATAEAETKTAEQALADFDAANPAVVAAIRAEQKAATERFLAAD